MSFTGQVALVTGASRGLGKAIAISLAKNGATVIGTATTEKGADSISAYFKEANIPASKGMVLNITEQDSVDQLLESFDEKPLILVNNAGITADNLFLRMKMDDWDKVIDANLSGCFRMIKACLRPMMKAKWGRIINVSSVVAVSGNPGQANYCAAKAGLIGLSKSLAQEIASRGITVNIVAPGFIDTDMTKELTEEQRTVLLGKIPVGRMGGAEDIANAVKFLASEEASYITGETIHVNGGMVMN